MKRIVQLFAILFIIFFCATAFAAQKVTVTLYENDFFLNGERIIKTTFRTKHGQKFEFAGYATVPENSNIIANHHTAFRLGFVKSAYAEEFPEIKTTEIIIYVGEFSHCGHVISDCKGTSKKGKKISYDGACKIPKGMKGSAQANGWLGSFTVFQKRNGEITKVANKE